MSSYLLPYIYSYLFFIGLLHSACSYSSVFIGLLPSAYDYSSPFLTKQQILFSSLLRLFFPFSTAPQHSRAQHRLQAPLLGLITPMPITCWLSQPSLSASPSTCQIQGFLFISHPTWLLYFWPWWLSSSRSLFFSWFNHWPSFHFSVCFSLPVSFPGFSSSTGCCSPVSHPLSPKYYFMSLL